MDKKSIKHICELANIELKEAEEKDISNQLNKILNYIKILEEIDIKDIPPTTHPVNIKNVLREDKLNEKAYSNDKKGNFFIVPKILEIQMLLKVIYKDENIILINKPAEIICHPVGSSQGDTLISRLKFYFGSHVRLLHRLDKKTSGIMLATSNPEINSFFQRQFEERSIKKEYLALVMGEMDSSEGIIDFPIKYESNFVINIKKKIAEDGLTAKTHYETLFKSNEISLLKLKPYSGRQHQIRIHLSAMGNPVIGDTIYYKGGMGFLYEYYLDKPSIWNNFQKGNALHAYKLEMEYPENKITCFKAGIPEYWHQYIKTHYPYLNELLEIMKKL